MESFAIVLAEDNADTTDRLRGFCRERGLVLDLISDKQQAIDKVRELSPGFLIIDKEKQRTRKRNEVCTSSSTETHQCAMIISGSADKSDLQPEEMLLSNVHLLRAPFAKQELEDLLGRLPE